MWTAWWPILFNKQNRKKPSAVTLIKYNIPTLNGNLPLTITILC